MANGASEPRAVFDVDEHVVRLAQGSVLPLSEPVADDWLLWQLADSAFPTGGFAHSGGLEAAWQHREINTSAELQGFVQGSLVQLGRGMLPFMTTAFDEPERLAELDGWCDAFLTNHVANRASRLQGRALLASAGRIFNGVRVDAEPGCGHLAPGFGMVMRRLNLERARAARLFLFWHLRGWLASAVRLGLVGPMEAQTLQFGLGAVAEDVLGRCIHIKVEDAAQTAPLFDLWQGAQDRLYSRLFQS